MTSTADRIGIIILGFDLLLFLLLILLAGLRMIDGDEFNEALVLLIPLRSIYAGNIVRYLIADNSRKVSGNVKSPSYGKVVAAIVVVHFISVIGVLIIFGLGGDTDIFWLRNGIAFIEIFFGVYLSQIIPDLFVLKKSEEA